MKNAYYKHFIAVFFLSSTIVMAQGNIKRASLSTSVAGSHAIQKGPFNIQQSIGHTGVMGTVNKQHYTVLQGFLLPQSDGAQALTDTPEFDMIVYPNPFETYVDIDFDTAVSGDMVIQIHDILGQLVIEQKQTAKKTQRLFLRQLAQAEYIMSVEVMGKTFIQTLLNYHFAKPSQK